MSTKKSISIDEWVRLAGQGCASHVTTLLNGESMLPLIRRNTDPVTIAPITRELMPGDVVLFTDGKSSDGKRYVVHRIYKIDKEKDIVQTWGDGCVYPDAPIPAKNVLGLAVKYTRNGRDHILDSDEARLWGIEWMSSPKRRKAYFQRRKISQLPRRAVGKAKRILKKITTRGNKT